MKRVEWPITQYPYNYGLIISIPMRIESRKNRREHFAIRRRREKPQEIAVWANLMSALGGKPSVVPCVVTLCRIGKKLLDTDNVQFSTSHIRDIVAKTFGVDDGPTGPIEWRYDQRLGSWAVEIGLTFEQRDIKANADRKG